MVELACADAAADNGLDVRTDGLLGASFERVLSEVGNAQTLRVAYTTPDAPAELEALGVQHALADAEPVTRPVCDSDAKSADALAECEAVIKHTHSDPVPIEQVLGRDAVPEPGSNVGADSVAFLCLYARADVVPVV